MSEEVEKRARLLSEKAAREAARAKALEAREILVLELEERFEKELGGPMGSEFDIVHTGFLESPIVVKRPSAVEHKTLTSAKDLTDAMIGNYVRPNVLHPSKEEYLAIVDKRPALNARCANAMTALQGNNATAEAGKF